MEKVVLITGASSGIGMETAKLFQSKNWKVAATMRDISRSEELQRIADIECFRLDVTEPESIGAAIAGTLEKFGRLDAVVNNAGYWLFGAFESATPEQMKRQFDTNLFGTMNVCREVLPHFREQKSGTIINISSVAGRVAFPAASAYCASKFALEGFSESLRYELMPFNISVKLIEPGPIATDFYGRSEDMTVGGIAPQYDVLVKRVRANMQNAADEAPDGKIVAETIYEAARDNTNKLRYGVNTKGLLTARKLLPDGVLFRIVKDALAK